MSERVFKGALVVSIIALILAAVVLAYTYMALSGLRGEVASMSDRLSGLDERLKLVAKAAGIPIEEPEEMKLIAAAREEGTLVIYTTVPIDVFTDYIKAFNAKYPFIKVDFYRGTSEKIRDKVLAEFKAGKHLVDILWVGDPITMYKLAFEEGIFQEYVPRRVKEVPDFQPAHLKKLLVYPTSIEEVLEYNTKLVKPEEVPRSIYDLLDPRWKGKIAMDDELSPIIVGILEVMGREKGTEFLRRLAQQDIMFRTGHTTVYKAVETGEAALGFGYRHHVATGMAKGAPVAWTAFTDFPIVMYLQNIGIYKYAPHPNAAKLWIEFFLSQEGQKVIYGGGKYYWPMDPAVRPEEAKKYKAWLYNVEVVRGINYEEYSRLFKGIFGLG
jgi:iron(III) transport system substrate-binding protein